MSWNKTARLPRQDQARVTAAEWFAGGQRIWYDPGSARILTEEQAAATSGVLLHLSIKRNQLAGAKFAFKITGVEPGALQRRPTLPGGHLEDVHPGAGAKQARSAHLRQNGGHLAGL